MCGRFTLRVTGEAFERQFGITQGADGLTILGKNVPFPLQPGTM
jgi:hypothetical protein